MPKVFCYIFQCLILSLFLCPGICLCDFEIDEEDEWDDCEFEHIEELGEYGETFLDFECALEEIEEEEDGELEYICGSDSYTKNFFIGKTVRKVKRWAKKRTINIIKNILKIKVSKNPDDMAYSIVHAKRRLDKYYKTGSIDKLFKKMDKHCPKEHPYVMEDLKRRIDYLWNHPKEKSVPIAHYNSRRPEPNGELDNIPVKAVIGGVEVACGCLMIMIPFPPIEGVGAFFIGHGLGSIIDAYADEYLDYETGKLKEYRIAM